MRFFVLLLMFALLCSVGMACHDDHEKGKEGASSAVMSDTTTDQKIVHVDRKAPGPKVMHDGSPAHIVDMRVRAPLAMEGVKPVGDSWQAGGSWNVHEITYRDGGLKFELAFEVPSSETKMPMKSKGRLRWISGDAHPFLKSLAYVFQTRAPRAGQSKGKFVDFDLLVQSTSAKDVGTMKMEPEGGDWTVVKASVPGTPSASFRVLLLPTKGLARIVPLPGESSGVVLGLFGKALL